MEKNTETLYTLMDKQLRNMGVPKEYKSLEMFIDSDDTCVSFIQYILHDSEFTVPESGSDIYKFAKARARHSVITFLMGLVFAEFAGIAQNISEYVAELTRQANTKKSNNYLKAYLDVPNPIMTKHKGNPLVRAMFWLQKDFYEDKKTNITMPFAEPIFQMRNDLEHNCLRTGTQAYGVTFTKYTVDGMIENNTYKLLRLARELIIYLCLAIEYDRKTIKLSSMLALHDSK